MSKDTYLIQNFHESRGPSHVTVNEHRAPTDESIRIYQEMLEKAEKNIYKAFKVDNNQLKCTIVKNMASATYFGPTFVAIMELNGKRAKIEQEILHTEQETFTALIEKMANIIACNMLEPAMNEYMNNIRF